MMKHRRREPCSGVSSYRCNISREMRGRVPKIPKSPAIQNQRNNDQAVSRWYYLNIQLLRQPFNRSHPQPLLRKANAPLIETTVAPRTTVLIIPHLIQQ